MEVLSIEEIEATAGGLAFLPLLGVTVVGGFVGGYAYGYVKKTFFS